MLTVDFERLDVRAGQRFLDLGCGAGRHSFEALRRGATVVSLDYDASALPQVKNLMWAMVDEGQAPKEPGFGVLRGDALHLPFPDASFDRIIISEVLEHIRDDAAALAEVFRILAPGGIVAATVPSWGPEKVCWALSAEYHAPLAEGGHVRIYTRRELTKRIADSGAQPFDWHRAHALHAPYWWLKCAIGLANTSNPLVKAYENVLVWDIGTASPVTRVPESLLNPVLGKSVVVYARKPGSRTPSVSRRGNRASVNT